jgi:hypothetical protein
MGARLACTLVLHQGCLLGAGPGGVHASAGPISERTSTAIFGYGVGAVKRSGYGGAVPTGIEDLITKQDLANFIRQIVGQPKSPLAQMMAGGVGIYSFGSGTVTFTASASSAVVSPNHGLGRAPVAVLLTGDGSGAADCLMESMGGFTTTKFDCRGRDAAGVARTGTSTFYWLALA